jgi:hypothetical protein
VQRFEESLLPSLKSGPLGVDAMHIYNLLDAVEQADSVGVVYRKSLLYLISRAFEEQVEPPAALLGMQRFSADVERLRHKNLQFHYSDGRGGSGAHTSSPTHGGFDNDAATMNSVLKTVLGGARVRRPFTRELLQY